MGKRPKWIWAVTLLGVFVAGSNAAQTGPVTIVDLVLGGLVFFGIATGINYFIQKKKGPG
jgi:hypothetical protein